MPQLAISETDLDETFVHSSGPGGQNVNKVATCVMLRHAPTGISVKCQSERSQVFNRFQARWLLTQKIAEQRARQVLNARHEREKRRRQKRRLSERAKEEMLHQKQLRARKKSLRRKIDFHKNPEF